MLFGQQIHKEKLTPYNQLKKPLYDEKISDPAFIPCTNNGGDTDYYAIPKDAKTLNDLIEYKNMQPWQHEVMKAIYALDDRAKKNGGSVEREINKIIYYANRGLELCKQKKK